MGKPRRNKSVKKAQAGQLQHDEELKKSPHSFVFHRGHVGKNINELIRDMRRVMSPYTASSLKVNKKNVLNDFVSIAGPLNVTHFLIFTKTETANNLRIVRLPRGPTLTFQIKAYSLIRDVLSSLKRHNMEPKQFLNPPLLVMNNLSGEAMHMKLMAAMFQNMFPSINVSKVKLGSIRRCVLLHYDSEQKIIQFRHYNVRAVPVGMSHGVKKIIKAKIPDLSRFHDISEFLIRGGDQSESEAEQDGAHNEVILPQDIHTRGNIQSQRSAIRLTEIGPRLNLHLVKIEGGLCEGEVLFHQFISKSPEEIEAAQKLRDQKKHAKETRKRQQEANVRRKADEKNQQRERTLVGMKNSSVGDQDCPEGDSTEQEEVDDDAEYYREEVGEEPDSDLLFHSSRGKTGVKRTSLSKSKSSMPKKKARVSIEKLEEQNFCGTQNRFTKFKQKIKVREKVNTNTKIDGQNRQRGPNQFELLKSGLKTGAKRKIQRTGKRKFKGKK